MASPVGHSLVAGALFLGQSKSRQMDWRLLVFCIVFANFPDVDVLPGILMGDTRLFHREALHSVAFGAVITAPAVIIMKRYQRWFSDHSYTRLFLVGFALFLSHLALDLVTLDNGVPYGVPLLWPFSGQYFALPFYVVPNVLHAHDVVSLHNVKVALRELALYGVPFLYFALVNRGFLGYKSRAGLITLLVLEGLMFMLFVETNPFYR